MILRSKVLPIAARSALMVKLRGKRRSVVFASESFFLSRRTSLYAIPSAIETDGGSVVDDHRAVVNIGHIRDADVGHRAVVIKRAPAPLAAHESHSGVAEPVVNTTIETDVRPPISGMPDVKSSTPSPVAGRPQQTDRCDDPASRNPVIAIVIVPGPIPGCPDVAGARTNGLCVNGQRWRPDANRDTDRNLTEGCRRKCNQYHR